MTTASWLLSMKWKTRVALSVALVLAQLAAGIFWAMKSYWASAAALLFAGVLQSFFYWWLYRSERRRQAEQAELRELEERRGGRREPC